MRVNIEHIEYLMDERFKINDADLSKIKFFKNGKRVKIPKKYIRDFQFMGLNNIDFITTGFYLTGWKGM